MTATILHGGCIEVMRGMDDNSIDAIVTDPPYGLEFMGKDWDKFGSGKQPKIGDPDGSKFRQQMGTPSFTSDGNPTCRNCKGDKYRDGPRKCTCDSPNFGHPARDQMVHFQQWCQEWATEALRVLKPGGHMLAFGGTRTSHRLAVAIEDAGFEIRDSIAWLYGSGFPKSLDVSKAIDKAAGAVRDVVGVRSGGWKFGPNSLMLNAGADRPPISDTAPATDAAQQWAGWGTALKPAHEIIVHGTKPARQEVEPNEIGSHITRLESEWLALEPALITRTGAAAGSSDQTVMSPSESVAVMCWNTVTSWRNSWAEICSQPNTSITSTTFDTIIDLRILGSYLSKITAESMPAHETSPAGLTPLAAAVDNLFGAALLSWRATHRLSATERATDCTQRSHLVDHERGHSAHEPIIVARKPLIGTVAANVLEHGTGGINVDACRIAADWDSDPNKRGWQGGNSVTVSAATGNFGNTGDRVAQPNPAGRWPANVALDEPMAAILDEQAPNTGNNGQSTRPPARLGRDTYAGNLLGTDSTPGGPKDKGGASRFFPVFDVPFKYQAKAPTSERPSYADADGNKVAHSTVKPLRLIQWLCKLVTPPGGTILDPFAGSGTTLEAAILEGFDVVGIEREAEYLPLIEQRIARAGHVTADPVETVPETPKGRWPANVALDEPMAAILDLQSGETGAHGTSRGARTAGGVTGWASSNRVTECNDSGGASRFFFVAPGDTSKPLNPDPRNSIDPEPTDDGGLFEVPA